MAKKNSKLEIRTPGQEVPALAFYESMGVTLTVCAVFFLVLTTEVFWKDRVQVRDTRSPAAKLVDELEESLDEAPTERVWTPTELEAAFAAGDLNVTERACEALARVARGEQELSASEREKAERALAVTLREGEASAPVTCAVRSRFDGSFEGNGEVKIELEKVWEQVKADELDRERVGAMVERMMVERSRPEAPEFYHWLRRCAMGSDVERFLPCVSMLRQIAPKQGEDYLMMLDTHVSQEGWDAAGEAEVVTKALARVALMGQPRQWSIERTAKIKRYDYESRIGAVFMLCRLAQSPEPELQEKATQMLGHASKMGARTPTADKIARWREGCQLAFGKPLPNLDIVELPLISSEMMETLEVWSGEEGDAPRHGLEYVFSTGACVSREGEPMWRCGVSDWKGEESDTSDALRRLYVHTRYIEWDEWEQWEKKLEEDAVKKAAKEAMEAANGGAVVDGDGAAERDATRLDNK